MNRRPRRKYTVTEGEHWLGGGGQPMVTYTVTDGLRDKAEVWWNTRAAEGTCYSSLCEGLLGPSRSCRHVQAVQRRASAPEGDEIARGVAAMDALLSEGDAEPPIRAASPGGEREDAE